MFNLQERDAFREIIQTYENEVTLSITSPLTAHRKQPNMKELDNMMTGYQKQVNSLEAELEKVRAQSMQDKTTIQQVRHVQGHKKFILCFSDTVRVTFSPPHIKNFYCTSSIHTEKLSIHREFPVCPSFATIFFVDWFLQTLKVINFHKLLGYIVLIAFYLNIKSRPPASSSE